MPVFTSGGSAVGTGEINNGAILNEDINDAADISRKKLDDSVILKVTKSTAQGIGAEAVISFDVEAVDLLGAHAAGVFTAPRAMNVMVMVQVPTSTNTTTAHGGTVAIRKNGTSVRRNGFMQSAGANLTGGGMVIEYLTLATNDTIDATVQSSSSGSIWNLGTGDAGPCMTICEI